MDKWKELKMKYVNDHTAKEYLKAPQIRLNAMESIEKIMTNHFEQLMKHPKIILQIEKSELKNMLASKKGSKLNAAEESVVNGLYKFLPEL